MGRRGTCYVNGLVCESVRSDPHDDEYMFEFGVQQTRQQDLKGLDFRSAWTSTFVAKDHLPGRVHKGPDAEELPQVVDGASESPSETPAD